MNIDPMRIRHRIARGDWTEEERDFLIGAVDFLLARQVLDRACPPNVNVLRKAIEQSPSFTPPERKVILDLLMLNTYRPGEHTYPGNLAPHSSPAAMAAWGLLDQLPPGALTQAQRFMFAGNLAVALAEATKGRLPFGVWGEEASPRLQFIDCPPVEAS
jgi:hypothetical protein